MSKSKAPATPPSAPIFGARGTQVTSKTLWGGGKNQPRIDVENPNPGKRAGQIHYQHGGKKYLYDASTGQFKGAPNAVNDLLGQPDIHAAIQKGLKLLGETQ